MAAFATSLGERYRGDTIRIAFQVFDEEGGDPLDTTGADVWLSGKLAILDPDGSAVFIKTNDVGGGIEAVDEATGQYLATLDPGDTDSLTATSTVIYIDIQVKDAGGDITTVATYKLTILAEITVTTTI